MERDSNLAKKLILSGLISATISLTGFNYWITEKALEANYSRAQIESLFEPLGVQILNAGSGGRYLRYLEEKLKWHRH